MMRSAIIARSCKHSSLLRSSSSVMASNRSVKDNDNTRHSCCWSHIQKLRLWCSDAAAIATSGFPLMVLQTWCAMAEVGCRTTRGLLLTPSLPRCHLKTTNKSAKSETLQPFLCGFFTLVCKRFFIRTHTIKCRCATGLENVLFAGASVRLSAQKFYSLRQ